MDAQTIPRLALFFLAVAAAATSSLWAQRDPVPASQLSADTTLAEWLADNDARVSDLIGATVVDGAGKPIGEIKDFVVSAGNGMRAVVGLDEQAGAAEGRLIAVPFDAVRIDRSGVEARAVPEQSRVRVELSGTPIEALPAFAYPKRGTI